MSAADTAVVASPGGTGGAYLAARSSVRVGVDLTPVGDVARSMEQFGERYARRLFTDHELSASRGASGVSAASLAARFAAKEAALKVLAPSGSRPQWRDIEVRRRPSGACDLELHGRAATLASARGLGPMGVSLSHEGGVAVAVVVAMCDAPSRGDGAGRGSSRPPGRPRPGVANEQNRSKKMTMTDESTARIREVLASHARLPVDVSELRDDDDLFQAGMTSHASVNVMLALEDAFDVEFPEALLRKSTFASIGALRRALSELEALEVGA